MTENFLGLFPELNGSDLSIVLSEKKDTKESFN